MGEFFNDTQTSRRSPRSVGSMEFYFNDGRPETAIKLYVSLKGGAKDTVNLSKKFKYLFGCNKSVL